MSAFCFNKLTHERACLAAAKCVPVEVFSADEAGGGPQGQEPSSGTGEAGDIY